MEPAISTKHTLKLSSVLDMLFHFVAFFSLCAKLLGLEIDSEVSFTYHVEKLCKKLSRLDWIGVLNEKIRSCLPTKQRLLYYNTMIRSVLHHVSSIWTSCDKENLSRVFKLQKRAARVISDTNNQASSVKLFNSLQWLPFYEKVKIAKCCVAYKRIKGEVPLYIEDFLRLNSRQHRRVTRCSNIILFAQNLIGRRKEEVINFIINDSYFYSVTVF